MIRYLLLSLLLAVRLAAQVAPGMSEADLLAQKGAPSGKMSVGSTAIYKWPDMNVTVVNGTVSKVAQIQASTRLSAAQEPEARPAAKPVPFSGNFQSHWQDESQYIVENISADVAEMFIFARTGKATPAGALSVAAVEDGPDGYRVSIQAGPTPPCEARVVIQHTIFSSDTFKPLTDALAGRYGALKPSEGIEIAGLLESLTVPRADTVVAADLSVSAELTKNFLAATAHEQAALVLAAFALREHSGKFCQILSELCRMSAHLTFAAALRSGSEPTTDGRVAEAAMLALLNASADSQAQLRGFTDAEPGTAEWRRALGLLNTGDIKRYAAPETPSLLERFERFEAVLGERGAAVAWQEVSKLSVEQRRLPDWGRIASSGYVSVGVGHELLASALKAELVEIGSVYELTWVKKVTMDALVTSLNVEPRHCVTLDGNGEPRIEVIGWGRWAAFLQRHLCHTVASNFNFLERMWGVPDEARDFRKDADKAFWGLTLYPFVRRLNATAEPYYRSAQDAEMALVRSTPQVVPAEAWNYVSYDPGFCPRYYPPPHPFINEWHKRNPPPGTAYNIFPRLTHPSLMNRPDLAAALGQLHAIAPWDTRITKAMLKAKFGDRPTGAQVLEGYRDVSDYKPVACYEIALAYKNDPPTFTQWMAHAAGLNPVYFYDLADYLKEHGRDVEAVAAYEAAFGEDDDAVRVANRCGWIVKYYESHGRSEDATRLANKAADVYSSLGLETKASLQESRHDYKGALLTFNAINDRYNNAVPLLSFLLRVHRAAPDAAFEAQLKSVSEQAVSGGLDAVGLGSFVGPPMDGMLISNENGETKKAGIALGDVVVAVHGYRVRDFRSYKVLRDVKGDGPLDLILWRTDHYLALTASPPNGRFGPNFADYRAK